MKRILLLFIVFSIELSYSQNRAVSFENDKKMAIATNKLMILDFWASWCGPCVKMDNDVWSKKEVRNLTDNFVMVKINVDENRDLAKHFGVRGIPNILIVDANGKILNNDVGYKSKSYIIDLLNKFSVETYFMQNQLVSYYKKQNFSTTLRLANKYQQFSMFLNSDIKNIFLNLADEYFDMAKKLLKQSKTGNKKMLLQKIWLLKLRKKVIQNKSKKVLQKLEKLKDNGVLKSNLSLYALLNYVSYKQLENEEKSHEWKIKLNEIDLNFAKLILEKR